MSALLDDASRELAQLCFRQTVDRWLLHRSALSEVFLTDCRPLDGGGYLAAAQLPPLHAYYTDHLHRVPVVDPILLLECCRQAETYGGHVVFGVSADTHFILRDWSMRVYGAEALVRTGGPLELGMVVRTSGHSRSRGTLRAVVYEIDLVLDGRPIGAARISVAYLAPEAYQHVRWGRRGSPPPSSATLTPDEVGVPVAPHLVGRSNPGNVLLLDPVLDGTELTARLRPALNHPSMFDHAQDHIPGMVITEAARQGGLLAAHELYGLSPSRLVLTDLRATFGCYAELDAPAVLRVNPATGVEDGGGCRLFAELEQQGTVTAEIALRLMPTAPPTATTRADVELAGTASPIR